MKEAQAIADPQRDVRAFMEAFGKHLPIAPQWPDQETMDLHVRLVAEKFGEWLRDSGYEGNLWISRFDARTPEVKEIAVWCHAPDTADEIAKRSLPESTDALIDLIYVAVGSLLSMGIDMWPLWACGLRCNVIGGKARNLEPRGGYK